MALMSTKRRVKGDIKEPPSPEDHEERTLDPKLAEHPDFSDDEIARPSKKTKRTGAYRQTPLKPQSCDVGAPKRNDFNPSGTLPESPTPTQTLRKVLQENATRRDRGNVVYWMRMRDLRVDDNRALAKASALARTRNGSCLIAVHILSPQDYVVHDRSPRRIDFVLRNLRELQNRLENELRIPLVVLTHEPRTNIPTKILTLCKEWGASEIVGNIEHEVDELWRDIKVVEEAHKFGVHADFVDDTYIVPPGSVNTKDGRQYSVFSPWSRAWANILSMQPDLLEESPPPLANETSTVDEDSIVRTLFGTKIPSYVPGFECKDADYMSELWPAGAAAANSVLDNFIHGKGRLNVLEGPATNFSRGEMSSDGKDSRITVYQTSRNLVSENGSSRMSPYLSAGVISARACLRRVWASTSAKTLSVGRDSGAAAYNLELGFRDFYGHVLAAWPRVCMGRAYIPKYERVAWEDDNDTFNAWKEGRTGYPIVDASIRQGASQGYMHNRGRMIVAMFLTKHLMIDWRKGEAWFMQQFIDGDFASNNGGWQWSASTGTDPQPYFRIFSPLSQSEKSDPDGHFIRHWVPELAGVKGKAIHAPFDRLPRVEFDKLGYPTPIVEHKAARERALRRFKNVGER